MVEPWAAPGPVDSSLFFTQAKLPLFNTAHASNQPSSSLAYIVHFHDSNSKCVSNHCLWKFTQRLRAQNNLLRSDGEENDQAKWTSFSNQRTGPWVNHGLRTHSSWRENRQETKAEHPELGHRHLAHSPTNSFRKPFSNTKSNLKDQTKLVYLKRCWSIL